MRIRRRRYATDEQLEQQAEMLDGIVDLVKELPGLDDDQRGLLCWLLTGVAFDQFHKIVEG